MTDIVERLRAADMIEDRDKYIAACSELIDDAADEIERLRADLAAENEACARLVELSRKLAGTTIVAAAIRARVKQ